LHQIGARVLLCVTFAKRTLTDISHLLEFRFISNKNKYYQYVKIGRFIAIKTPAKLAGVVFIMILFY